jgi:hypothetical protein
MYSTDRVIASNIHTSPTHLSYPTSQPGNTQSSTQTSNQPVPRFRAASSVFPAGLHLRNQYRAIPTQSPIQDVPTTPRTPSFASAFSSGGFQSAPLMARAEYHMPRTPVDAGPREYHMSQFSAPMAPPQDFSAAYSRSMSPGHTPAAEHPSRGRQHENLNLQDLQNPLQPHHQQQQQQQQEAETTHYLRQDEYDLNSGTKGRKRTYSMSGTFEGQ